jgi:hypothetical protein
MANEINVIADNGGGITLQVINDNGSKYQHTHDDADQCATDIKAALAGDNAARDWDGNEVSDDDDSAWLISTDDQIRNGGYREVLGVTSVSDFEDWDDCGWGNCTALAKALGA